MTEEASELERRETYCPVLSVLEETHRRSGSNGMMDTPVPIPNTEVKHHRGEDSTLCENSTLPVLFFYGTETSSDDEAFFSSKKE